GLRASPPAQRLSATPRAPSAPRRPMPTLRALPTSTRSPATAASRATLPASRCMTWATTPAPRSNCNRSRAATTKIPKACQAGARVRLPGCGQDAAGHRPVQGAACEADHHGGQDYGAVRAGQLVRKQSSAVGGAQALRAYAKRQSHRPSWSNGGAEITNVASAAGAANAAVICCLRSIQPVARAAGFVLVGMLGFESVGRYEEVVAKDRAAEGCAEHFQDGDWRARNPLTRKRSRARVIRVTALVTPRCLNQTTLRPGRRRSSISPAGSSLSAERAAPSRVRMRRTSLRKLSITHCIIGQRETARKTSALSS